MERHESQSGAATDAVETAEENGACVPFEGQNYANKSADVFQGEAEEIQADKCHWTGVDAGRDDVEEQEQDLDHDRTMDMRTNLPAGISDRSPRGFDPSNLVSSEDDEVVQDCKEQPGDGLDGKKWQVSTLSSSSAVAGPLALRGGTKYPVEDSEANTVSFTGQSNGDDGSTVSKGMVDTGTLCYRFSIPPPVSQTDGDNQGQYLTKALACEQPRYKEAGSGQPRCREAAGEEPRKRAAATAQGDLTRLACLWSQQELCGRRPAKYDPFKWACKERTSTASCST